MWVITSSVNKWLWRCPFIAEEALSQCCWNNALTKIAVCVHIWIDAWADGLQTWSCYHQHGGVTVDYFTQKKTKGQQIYWLQSSVSKRLIAKTALRIVTCMIWNLSYHHLPKIVIFWQKFWCPNDLLMMLATFFVFSEKEGVDIQNINIPDEDNKCPLNKYWHSELWHLKTYSTLLGGGQILLEKMRTVSP